MDSLLEKIKGKKAKIGVVGMGYVGLPLSLLVARKGFEVVGLTRREEQATTLNNGKHHLLDEEITQQLASVLSQKKFRAAIISPSELQMQDIIIVCVPTPVDEHKNPDIADLKNVASLLSQIDLQGKLIINESTVAPFATRDVFGNIGKGFFLATSPERVDPGNKAKSTEHIAKVLGGIDEESAKLGKDFYESILVGKVVTVKSLEAAEMSKMLENTYRAVNIALINEFAKLADACNIDILDVIEAAKTKWSFHAHYPGIGVGGHCIPVDPYYILELGKKKSIEMSVIEKSLKENEGMPEYIEDKLLKIYEDFMKVTIYGITYKKDVNDLRESPVVEFCKLLQSRNVVFSIYDPMISDKKIQKLGFNVAKKEKVDIFIVGTDHSSLDSDYSDFVSEKTIVIDGRNHFPKKIGKKVLGVGRNLL